MIGFIVVATIIGLFFLRSIYMQQVLGCSPLYAGVAYLAIALTIIASAGIAQGLVTRIGVKPVLVTGMILNGIGLVFFTFVSVNGTYLGDLLPGFLLVGVGMGFSFVPVSIAALAGVQGPEAGLASGLINTSQQIGGALGLALLTTVATTHAEGAIADGTRPPVAFTDGFSLAFWVSAGFAVLSLATTLVALRSDELEVAAAQQEAAPVPVA